jgi:hypothetical protein
VSPLAGLPLRVHPQLKTSNQFLETVLFLRTASWCFLNYARCAARARSPNAAAPVGNQALNGGGGPVRRGAGLPLPDAPRRKGVCSIDEGPGKFGEPEIAGPGGVPREVKSLLHVKAEALGKHSLRLLDDYREHRPAADGFGVAQIRGQNGPPLDRPMAASEAAWLTGIVTWVSASCVSAMPGTVSSGPTISAAAAGERAGVSEQCRQPGAPMITPNCPNRPPLLARRSPPYLPPGRKRIVGMLLRSQAGSGVFCCGCSNLVRPQGRNKLVGICGRPVSSGYSSCNGRLARAPPLPLTQESLVSILAWIVPGVSGRSGQRTALQCRT